MNVARILVLILFATLLITACGQNLTLVGTDLGAEDAPNFELHDSSGKLWALSDWHGRIVVLTFLYTHCPDECPLIAERLRAASQQMGTEMSQVAMVAVSVDPVRDTPESVQSFLQQHQLTNRLTYLLGSPAELKPVWDKYYLGVKTDPTQPGLVAHSSRIILIDGQGKQRINLDTDFHVGDLVGDVRALVANARN